MRAARSGVAVVLAGLAALGPSGRASAAGPAIEVRVNDCADVDGREVERLLAIELAVVAAQHPAPGTIAVALACAGARLQMTAQDPILNRRLAREVVLGPPEPGRERTIALLVSQLFLTSWAEGLLERPATTTAPAVPQAPPSSTVVVRGAEPPPPAARLELRLESGLRLRDWASPAWGEQVSLGAAFQLKGRLRALVELDFEHGSADRAAGVVSWSIGAAGLGAGWRSRRHGVVAFDSSALASLGVVDVRGDASSPAVGGSTLTGVVGQAALGAGPVFFWGAARLGLELQLGATFPTATARVSGEPDVALAGLWAGAGLSVGAGWAPR